MLADVLRQLGIRTLGSSPCWTRARYLRDLVPKEVLPTGLPGASTSDRWPSGTLQRTSRFVVCSTRLPTGPTPWRLLPWGSPMSLSVALLRHGLAATQLLVEAETEHGESLQRWWRGDRPFGARAIVDRVRWQLEGWLQGPVITAPTAGVTMLRLTVTGAVPDDGRQMDFEGGLSGAEPASRTRSGAVQGLLGHEAVLTAVRTRRARARRTGPPRSLGRGVRGGTLRSQGRQRRRRLARELAVGGTGRVRPRAPGHCRESWPGMRHHGQVASHPRRRTRPSGTCPCRDPGP